MATQISPIPNLPKPVKEEKPRRYGLPKVSEKMRTRNLEYAKVKRIWWAARLEIDGGRCQFVDEEGNRCQRQASQSPHHIYGRGKYLCDPSTFCALCLPGHHDWVTANGKEAEARGYLVRTFRLKEAAA